MKISIKDLKEIVKETVQKQLDEVAYNDVINKIRRNYRKEMKRMIVGVFGGDSSPRRKSQEGAILGVLAKAIEDAYEAGREYERSDEDRVSMPMPNVED